jgi:tight adherence protein C
VSAPLGELVLFVAAAALWWPEAAVRRPEPAWRRGPARSAHSPRRPLRTWVGLWVAAAVAAGLVSLPLAAVVAVAGPLIYRQRAKAAAGRRQQYLADSLPEALDACTVVVGAGGTIRDSVEVLAARGPAPVRALAAEAIQRADAGQTFDQSLRWLQSALGPGYQPLTGALLLAQEQGGSVGLLLARLSAEANASRRRRGELRARRLPVTLLAPLVCCSLPAVLVGAVLPLAIVAFRHLDL